ncbi:N-acetylneuraminic acid mutarotase [Mucilaginibacter terrae]|uniref:N-acetylneuraminic acid mutarotase n=2 Tax=Mucilaginibacter terrae TaxID=1955052 RepID=A0ABU3H0P4_9SPHI|nr:N-acetylneuraminic acid mutarotase [Mucilaginibacter terrae]
MNTPTLSFWHSANIKRYLCLAVICLSFFAPQLVKAQSWQAVGEDENNQPIFSSTGNVSMVTGPDHKQYLAFIDGSTNKASVRRYNGTSWEQVGQRIISDSVITKVSIAFEGNTPYLAYAGNELGVKKFNGSNWVSVGSEVITGGASMLALNVVNQIPYILYRKNNRDIVFKMFENGAFVTISASGVMRNSNYYNPTYNSFAFDGTTPYIAYKDESNYFSYVKKFNGAEWVDVGSFNEFEASAVMQISINKGIPYIAYRSSSNKATVKYFSGNKWNFLGEREFTENRVSTMVLGFDDDTPYLLSQGGYLSYKAFIYKYTGGRWQQIGSSLKSDEQSDASVLALAFDNGTPYTFCQDGSAGGNVVRKYNGTDWEVLASKGFSLGSAIILDVKTDKNNTPYVLYNDYTNSYKCTLVKYNGSVWEVVGQPGFTTVGNVNIATLGFSADNYPMVVYRGSGTTEEKVFLSKFNGATWLNDNTSTLTLPSNAYYSVFSFDGSTPCVLYPDSYDKKLTLKRFNASAWTVWGATAFTDAYASEAELKIQNGIPYVAYRDEYGLKLTVMALLWNQWSRLGNVMETQRDADMISLAVGTDGVAYISRAGWQNTKLSVLKLVNGNWTLLGSAFNSSSPTNKPSLFISSANQPVVSFKDAGVTGRASSYRFDGANWLPIGSRGYSAYETMPYTFVYNNKLHAVYAINKLYHQFFNGDFIESRPSTAASNVKVNTLSANEAGISWKNGSGAARAVFVSTYDSGTITLPDGIEYTANAEYGMGSKAQNSSWYCVYNGTDTTVTVKKLSLGTHYKVAVFEYNGSGTEIKYTSPVLSMTKDFTTLARPITIAEGQWTWASGTQGFHSNGSPGLKEVSAPSNEPKARFGGMNWKDKNGDFWIMGGYGLYDFGQRNDLWKYTTQTGEWVWMSGEVTINPGASYGTKGVAAASNVPGGRQDALTWTDANGDLWLFGGFGFTTPDKIGYLNDLWKYSTATGLWTWVGGSDQINQYATYGGKGIENAGNYPGSRRQSVTWVDNNGNFWLMGGAGYAVTGTFGELNDLWKYNSLTNQWTWMSGNNVIYSKGVYGTKGVPSADNYPGGRADAVGWTDGQGNLWLMGGIAYLSNNNGGFANDLWKYNIATNQWTWMSGGNIGGEISNYGTQGVPSASNMPGSRYQASAWTDNNGNFWLMGGSGHNQYGILDNYNEMWVYSPATNMWTWIDGSTYQGQRGVYGTKGQAAPANRPGTRRDALTWTDKNNNLWLFGGSGMGGMGTGNAENGTLNDLWVYQPPELPWVKPALTSLTPDKGKLSPGFSADSINYTVKLPLGSKAIRFTPTAPNSATIKIQNNIIQSGSLSDSIALTNGDNIIPVVVSIGNESLSYKVTVKVGRYAAQLALSLSPKTYGDTAYDPGATSDNSKTPIVYTSSNNQVAQIVNGKVKIIRDGTVRITASQPAGNGYDAAVPVSQILTVNKAQLVVKAKDKNRIYGTANGTLTFIYTGFVNGDTPAKLTGGLPVASVNANASSPVGTYIITPVVKLSGFYELITEPGVLTITKAPLTVTTTAATRFYGAVNPAITFKYTGFVNNDGVSKLTIKPMAKIQANQLSLPGKYVVTVDGGVAQNYEFTYVPGTITIKQS